MTRDIFRDETSNLSFETCLERAGKGTHANLDVAEVTCALEETRYLPKKRWTRYEELEKGKSLSPPSHVGAPILELKSLPSHLRYAFLGKKNFTYYCECFFR